MSDPVRPSLARRAESLQDLIAKWRENAAEWHHLADGCLVPSDRQHFKIAANEKALCADDLEKALSRPSAPAWQPSARVLELATKAARYNHFELRHNGFQHGGHDALFETCPHPDCASVRQPLPSGPETR